MADTWNADSGILRKHKTHEVEELLVFGYSCKLFRDDEKALSIDQGKHLIPWMGDERVKIDRYDGRGALADLHAHEPIAQWDHNEGLTDEERRAEQLCDEERYRSLYEHVVEEEMYREEQLKRLHQEHSVVYGQVPFNYAEEVNKNEGSDSVANLADAEENEPYIPSPVLDIPVNMSLPSNKKLGAIIERTAGFIAQQGGQMEVLLKAKQQHNPQFEFLNHDNELFAFYRHILMAIKTGRYKPIEENLPASDNEATTNAEDEASYYLHPSLASNLTRIDSAPALPSIPALNYKPSADCAYSMLVNKIKGASASVEEKPLEKETIAVPVENTTNLDPYNQWHQYYNSEQYQEYYRQYYITHYGFDPTSLEYSGNSEISKSPIIYKAEETTSQNNEKIIVSSNIECHSKDSGGSSIPDDSIKQEKCDKSSKSKIKIGALAHYYNSDSDSDSEIEEENLVPIPSESDKLVIIKMASYVAKNGKEFEEIVKGKNDPRFEFLYPNHKYHIFYKSKLNFQLGSMPQVTNAANAKEINESNTKLPGEDVEEQKPKPIGPVSFSIKKPKETEHITTRPALPIEDSSDEESESKEEAPPSSPKMEKQIVEVEIINIEESINSPIIEAKNIIEGRSSPKSNKQNDVEKVEPVNNESSTPATSDSLEAVKHIKSPCESSLELGSQNIAKFAEDEMVISDPELSNASSPSEAIETDDIKSTLKSYSPECNQEIKSNLINEQTSNNETCNLLSEDECIDLTNEADDKMFGKEESKQRNGTKEDLSEMRVKQLQLDRKRRAMAFLNQLKSDNSKENVSKIQNPKYVTHFDDVTKEGDSRPSKRITHHKESKKAHKRTNSTSEDDLHNSSKSKKSKKKSHSHSSKTHKHRKHSKSNHHDNES